MSYWSKQIFDYKLKDDDIKNKQIINEKDFILRKMSIDRKIMLRKSKSQNFKAS